MTLLETAKSYSTPKSRHNNITNEHIEVALAWARDEISYVQACHAFTGRRNGTMQSYVWMARAFREAIRKGLLKT